MRARWGVSFDGALLMVTVWCCLCAGHGIFGPAGLRLEPDKGWENVGSAYSGMD